ncbi:hypothetical protein DF281_13145 [Kurthia zopfii]|nr:hypothetical protein DF281_13145 [Kurthia zopfii]
MQREMMTVIDGIAETAGGIGLTRPSIIRKADNKVIQLGIASAIGFKLPNSLITNEDLVAKSFTSSNKTIVKPISVGKILSSNSVGFIQTNIVKATSEIKGLSNSPAYFQFYQPKDYEVRLTIVNEVFFGVRIDSSNKIDWRKEDAVLKYSKIDIPSDIAGKCLKMMCQLELKFAAFDFIVNNGDYFFLELNANGQWLWLEEELDIDISTEIMNVLVSGL